ncbi:hypothetical protein M3Y98_00644900 [Aphelenchoides besseyi]|nr:hypothetical protein M3Y98_00644900 [Aphelenchoides besseyi]
MNIDYYKIGMFGSTTLTLLLQFAALYLIVFVSPRTMRSYIRYLVICTVVEMLFTITYGLLLCYSPPQTHPGLGLYVLGISKYFGTKFVNFCAASLYALGAMELLSQDICLLYRLCAVHPNRELRARFSSIRWTVINYGIAVGFSLLVGIGLYVTIANQNEYEVIIQSWTSTLQTTIDLSVTRVLLRNNTPYYWFFQHAMGVFIVLSHVAYFVLIVRILLYLRSATISKRAITLNRQLTVLLGAQICVPLILFVLPYIVMLFQMQTKPTDNRQFVQIAMFFFSFHNAINALLTIFFVGPFRTAVLNGIRRLVYGKHSFVVYNLRTRSSFSVTV